MWNSDLIHSDKKQIGGLLELGVQVAWKGDAKEPWLGMITAVYICQNLNCTLKTMCILFYVNCAILKCFLGKSCFI